MIDVCGFDIEYPERSKVLVMIVMLALRDYECPEFIWKIVFEQNITLLMYNPEGSTWNIFRNLMDENVLDPDVPIPHKVDIERLLNHTAHASSDSKNNSDKSKSQHSESVVKLGDVEEPVSDTMCNKCRSR